MGYDEGRGDKIEVINMPFELEGLNEERELMQQAERKELIMTIVTYGLYAVVAVLLLLFVVRPLLRRGKKEGASLPGNAVRDVYIKEADEEAGALEKKKDARSLSPMQDKALVSTIIKEWVKESR